MKTTEEKLAQSLTANSIDLIPYLPYLLHDLWELGSSPNDMFELINQHVPISSETRILDLACGKGAVSVMLAQKLGCFVKGIDIMPKFIDFATLKAREYNVDDRCQFYVDNILESVNKEKEYDIVILGAVGDVLGTPTETITHLKKTIKRGGYILIDDAFAHDESNPRILTKQQWLSVLEDNKMSLIDVKLIGNDELISINNQQQALIEVRAKELIQRYPQHRHLFEDYIQSQRDECEQLEHDMVGVTMLLHDQK